jgi:hypothetical protein
MSNVADILAEKLIKAINDEYVRGALNTKPQLLTVTVDSMKASFSNAYVLTKEKFSKSSAAWPNSSNATMQAKFQEAAKASIYALAAYASRPRTYGNVRFYDGKTLTVWLPYKIPKYFSILKQTGLDMITSFIKSNGGKNFLSLQEGYRQAIVENNKQGLRNPESSELYSQAAGLSAEAHLGKSIHITHEDVTVGGARISAMLQVMDKFANTSRLNKSISSEASKDITDWLGNITATFHTGISKKDLGLIRLKGPEAVVGITMADASLNKSGDVELDFVKLKKPFIKFIKNLEKKGVFLKKYQDSPNSKALVSAVGAHLTDVLAESEHLKVLRRDPILTGGQQKGSSTKKAKKSPGKKPDYRILREKEIRQSPNALADRTRLDIRLQTLLQSLLHDQIQSNMPNPGSGGLVYRTGEFARNVFVKTNRTRRIGQLSLEYTYQKAPYGVFDAEIGRAPWQTEARDPRDLIEKSIREVAKGITTERFTTRRGN